MHNLAVAFDELESEIRRQAEIIEQIGEDLERLTATHNHIKAVAKSQPRQIHKSHISPYAKFDRIRRKRK